MTRLGPLLDAVARGIRNAEKKRYPLRAVTKGTSVQMKIGDTVLDVDREQTKVLSDDELAHALRAMRLRNG